jgi:UDP-N-acetylmuramoyl-tripeptide--D-alanyl-D-alanine ligase
MFELGDIAEIEHVKLADYIDQLELEGWIVLGSYGELMVKGRSGIYVESIEQAVDQLNKWIVSGDSVLIKGSRGTAMERILNFYKG